MPRKEKKSEGSPGWVTTMSDMNTLLLTFFVMLVSMLSLEKPKFSRLTAALSLAGMKFKPSEGRTAIPTVSIRPKPRPNTSEAQVSATNILNVEGTEMEATKTGDGVKYSFTSAELAFEEGKWELTQKQKQFLDVISVRIHGTVGTLYVYAGCDVGANDSARFIGGGIVPAARAGTPSGMGDKELLSLLRATAVQKYLSDVKRDKYIREDMIIPVGLADRAPRIANPANDEERAINRYIQVFAVDRKK